MFDSPYIFKDPLWFLVLLVIPVVLWLRGRRTISVLIVPFAAAWHRPSLAGVSRVPAALFVIGLVLMVAGMARPQKVEDKREVRTQGYDIMLAIDLSRSMLAMDYQKDGNPIDRLQAIKPVIKAFINDRPNDRIGIVVFSDDAYTLSPLTFDHEWLARQVERLKIGLVGGNTAIGDGLGVALTRLEQSAREGDNELGATDGAERRRQGAFVVVLTDGANNRGALTPRQATEIAKARHIPVYTIGAGTEGIVPMPEYDQQGKLLGYSRWQSDLDEETLRTIARETNGSYYRAYDNSTIERAFADIDRAKKIEFQAKSYLITTELFWWFAAPGAAVVLLAAFLSRLRGSKPAQGTETSEVIKAGAGASPTYKAR